MTRYAYTYLAAADPAHVVLDLENGRREVVRAWSESSARQVAELLNEYEHNGGRVEEGSASMPASDHSTVAGQSRRGHPAIDAAPSTLSGSDCTCGGSGAPSRPDDLGCPFCPPARERVQR